MLSMLLYHIGSRTTISPREKLLISSGGWGISGWLHIKIGPLLGNLVLLIRVTLSFMCLGFLWAKVTLVELMGCTETHTRNLVGHSRSQYFKCQKQWWHCSAGRWPFNKY